MRAAVFATVSRSKPGPQLPFRVLSQPLIQPISHCTISSGQNATLTSSRSACGKKSVAWKVQRQRKEDDLKLKGWL
jgi:hypothetical protein